MEQRSNSESYELVGYECQECGYMGSATVSDKKVVCPTCGTVNDVWRKGEAPPPNHAEQRSEPATERNTEKCDECCLKCDGDCKGHVAIEPTTAEIVKALRELAYQAEREGVTSLPCTIELMIAWAMDLEKTSSALSDCTARLEAQHHEVERLERENERLMAENKAMYDHVKVATGVAGQIDGYSPVNICGVPIDEAVKMLVEYQSIKEQLAAEKARADAAVKERDKYKKLYKEADDALEECTI